MTDESELMRRLSLESDPSRRLRLIDSLRPPEPQLLDTCILQNIDWVDRQIEITETAIWDTASEAQLVRKYGRLMADDLLDLGTLYKEFEERWGYYPWAVCNAAMNEAGLLSGAGGERLDQLIRFLLGHQEEWCPDTYAGVSPGMLHHDGQPNASPLVLQALGVCSIDELYEEGGPFDFLPDRGDRMITAHAVLSNTPAILTTDRKTFWAHRDQFPAYGVQVMRPSELLQRYQPYWNLLEWELSRRQRH